MAKTFEALMKVEKEGIVSVPFYKGSNMKVPRKAKLNIPNAVYIDFTDSKGHMHAHESPDMCSPLALVGKYVLVSTSLPSDRIKGDIQ